MAGKINNRKGRAKKSRVDRGDDAFLAARKKEKELEKKYKEGKVDEKEHYEEVVKVWSSVLVNVLSLFLLAATGIVGIGVFLIIMLSPLLD